MSGKVYPLQGAQRDAVDPRESVWLSASAGTGKTQVLSARVLRLLLEPALERAGSRQAVRALKAAVAAHSQIDEVAISAETSEFAAVWGSPANKAAVARAVSRRREKQQQQAAASTETNNRET